MLQLLHGPSGRHGRRHPPTAEARRLRIGARSQPRRATRAAIVLPRAFDTPFGRDVRAGLGQAHKSVPGGWLYDAAGCRLFERIAEAPGGDRGRTEALILHRCAAEIAGLAGPGVELIELADLVEPGGGPGRALQPVLAALPAPATYRPVAALAGLGALPAAAGPGGRRMVFISASTIGRLAPDPVVDLLQRLARQLGTGDLLVLGADGPQDPSRLLPAGADALASLAAFNKHLLVRMNRELGGDFEVDAFDPGCHVDTHRHRVEMHLVSRREQWARVAGGRFHFDPGESIHTGSLHAYGLLRLHSMASGAGWTQRQVWADARAQSSVQVFERVA